MGIKKKNTVWNYILFVVFLVFLGMCGVMFWKQCWMPNGKYFSDVTMHLGMFKRGGYSLFNFILSKAYLLSGENMTVMGGCCTLLLVGCQAMTVLLVYYLYRKMYPNKSNAVLFFFALTSVFVGAFFSHYMYGRSAMYANVWHNPTVLLMRPIMLGVLYCTFMIFKNEKDGQPVRKYLCLNAILSFFCMWAKPSFFSSFIPALGVFLLIELIKSKGKSFLFSCKLSLSFIGIVPILFYQFFFLFEKSALSKPNNSSIYWKTVWTWEEISMQLYNFFFSAWFIIIGMIMLFVFQKTNKRLLMFSCLYFFSSEIYHLFIKESGARAADGNFEWVKIAMLYVMMTFVAGEVFLKPAEKDIPKPWKVLAGFVYAGHLITGLMYFWHVFNGNSYFYYYNVL